MSKKFSRSTIGVVIYTHERVDDARINMEILRSVWQQANLFSSIRIVHAYNGKRAWYPKKYLEDVLVRQENPGHYQGASDLIDAGIAAMQKKFLEVQYIVVLAADTWCLKPEYLNRVIDVMHKQKRYVATCPWGLPNKSREKDFGLATDFFVVDVRWARKFKMFPLQYLDFWKKHHEIISYMKPGGNVSLERLMLARFHDASFRQYNDNVHRKSLAESSILSLEERIPVHIGKTKQGYWIRRFYWPKIGLATHHQPQEKQKVLKTFPAAQGKNISQLAKAKNFEYYNQLRAIRTSYD